MVDSALAVLLSRQRRENNQSRLESRTPAVFHAEAHLLQMRSGVDTRTDLSVSAVATSSASTTAADAKMNASQWIISHMLEAISKPTPTSVDQRADSNVLLTGSARSRSY